MKRKKEALDYWGESSNQGEKGFIKYASYE
jgi:hypothetical protein